MGKHIQEDSLFGKVGFNSLMIGDNNIFPENTDRVLKILAGRDIALRIENNQLVVESLGPKFETREW